MSLLTLFFCSGCGLSANITLPIVCPNQAIQLCILPASTNHGPASASLSFNLRIEWKLDQALMNHFGSTGVF